MKSFSYIDGHGVERIMRANSAEQAHYTIKQIEEERTGSIAAGDVAAATMRPYEPEAKADEDEDDGLTYTNDRNEALEAYRKHGSSSRVVWRPELPDDVQGHRLEGVPPEAVPFDLTHWTRSYDALGA